MILKDILNVFFIVVLLQTVDCLFAKAIEQFGVFVIGDIIVVKQPFKDIVFFNRLMIARITFAYFSLLICLEALANQRALLWL